MKTRAQSDKKRYRLRLIGADPVLFERIRASLQGGPFLFSLSPDAERRPDADLYVAPVEAAVALAGDDTSGVPVIAYGPAAMLRPAFLAGCADYLREPWVPEELGLRALAALARMRRAAVFPWGELALSGTTLATPGGAVALSWHEAAILGMLLRHRGTPVPRESIAYVISGGPGRAGGAAARGGAHSRAIDVHVAALRRKVGAAAPAAGRFITCVRGQGYLLE